MMGTRIKIHSRFLWEQDVPRGTIMMYSPAFGGAALPDGWALCDGGGGTPNLIDRFIRGSNVAGADAIGGVDNHSHTVNAHQHGGATGNDGGHAHTVNIHQHGGTTGNDGGHTHTVNAHNHQVPAHNHGGVTGAKAGWINCWLGAQPCTGTHDHTIPNQAGVNTDNDSPGTNNPGDHNHTVNNESPGTDNPGDHNHTINNESPGTDLQNNIPSFYTLVFIIKL